MSAPVRLDRVWLNAHPLPSADHAGDKDEKGRLLIVGGSLSVPGALLLSAEAAMRVGAGKVKIATVEEAALRVGIAFPEAAVIGLPTTGNGEVASSAARSLETSLDRADAVLVGPAMANGDDVRDLTGALLRTANKETAMVLDAGAVSCAAPLKDAIREAKCAVVLTPHCGEMASLMNMDKCEVEDEQVQTAMAAALQFGATVALKSSTTVIATPEGEILTYDSQCPGLGTAGSGDVLAGVIAGLLARGVEPLSAVAWGVWLHGACGREASNRGGAIGFMARDLPPLVPALLESACA
jgi:ADP-dependent NAD(P)H-hydrate dehydratase